MIAVRQDITYLAIFKRAISRKYINAQREDNLVLKY